MSLIRITPCKIAANRANARKSTGPRTAEGKARVSQNACRHRVYARKWDLSPEQAAEAEAHAAQVCAAIHHPAQRDLFHDILLLQPRENALSEIINQIHAETLARHRGNWDAALFELLTQNPLFLEALVRRNKLMARAVRLNRAYVALCRQSNLRRTKPDVSANTAVSSWVPVGSNAAGHALYPPANDTERRTATGGSVAALAFAPPVEATCKVSLPTIAGWLARVA